MAMFMVMLTYTDDDMASDRVRPEHRAYLASRPEVLAAGPLGDHPAGGLILVQADDEEAVDALVDDDQIHREGLVAERLVRPWNPVVGPLAATLGDA